MAYQHRDIASARAINDIALQHQGHEMNPRLLDDTELIRVIALNRGRIPENWPAFEKFSGLAANQIAVKSRYEPSPVWTDEYGSEEVMECLDEAE